MSTTPTSRGFIITVPIPAAIPASMLQDRDAFALPEAPDDHLIVQAIKPHPTLTTRLAINALGKTTPFTVHPEELLLPVRMLRTFNLTCHLCGRDTQRGLDLVLHGTPQTWICNDCN